MFYSFSISNTPLFREVNKAFCGFSYQSKLQLYTKLFEVV